MSVLSSAYFSIFRHTHNCAMQCSLKVKRDKHHCSWQLAILPAATVRPFSDGDNK